MLTLYQTFHWLRAEACWTGTLQMLMSDAKRQLEEKVCPIKSNKSLSQQKSWTITYLHLNFKFQSLIFCLILLILFFTMCIKNQTALWFNSFWWNRQSSKRRSSVPEFDFKLFEVIGVGPAREAHSLLGLPESQKELHPHPQWTVAENSVVFSVTTLHLKSVSLQQRTHKAFCPHTEPLPTPPINGAPESGVHIAVWLSYHPLCAYHWQLTRPAVRRRLALAAPQILPRFRRWRLRLCWTTCGSQRRVFVNKDNISHEAYWIEEGEVVCKIYADDGLIYIAWVWRSLDVCCSSTHFVSLSSLCASCGSARSLCGSGNVSITVIDFLFLLFLLLVKLNSAFQNKKK